MWSFGLAKRPDMFQIVHMNSILKLSNPGDALQWRQFAVMKTPLALRLQRRWMETLHGKRLHFAEFGKQFELQLNYLNKSRRTNGLISLVKAILNYSVYRFTSFFPWAGVRNDWKMNKPRQNYRSEKIKKTLWLVLLGWPDNSRFRPGLPCAAFL